MYVLTLVAHIYFYIHKQICIIYIIYRCEFEVILKHARFHKSRCLWSLNAANLTFVPFAGTFSPYRKHACDKILYNV